MAQVLDSGNEEPQQPGAHNRRSSLPIAALGPLRATPPPRDLAPFHRKSTSVSASAVDCGPVVVEEESAVGCCARCSRGIWTGINRWEHWVQGYYYCCAAAASYQITGLEARGGEARTNATSGALAGRYVTLPSYRGVLFFATFCFVTYSESRPYPGSAASEPKEEHPAVPQCLWL
jgi:hypothetical protein